MKILIACEFSGVVRDAFITKGHEAVSCDLLPTERPGPHIQGEVELILEDGWDMMIAFPPCTYLCGSGLHWNKRRPERAKKTHEAMLFVLNLLGEGFIAHGIPKIALENPIGCISTKYRKPDQIIQPWQFGEDASKKTCLWLKGLPKLKTTKTINPHYGCKCGHRFTYELGKYGCPNCGGDNGAARQIWSNQTPGGQNKLGPSDDRWKLRSITYQGIANAMAEQWGREDLKIFSENLIFPLDKTSEGGKL